MFAGDKEHYDEHGEDFRLNDDWQETQRLSPISRCCPASRTPTSSKPSRCWPPASGTSPTPARSRRHLGQARGRAEADARRLPRVGGPAPRRVRLGVGLPGRPPHLRRPVPSLPQATRPAGRDQGGAGQEADLMGLASGWCAGSGRESSASSTAARSRPASSATSSRCRRGRWTRTAPCPRTVQDATFVESRLHSLRTRNAAAYKGIYALLLGQEARDWMDDKALDKVQYEASPSTSTTSSRSTGARERHRRRAPREHRQQDRDRARTNRTIGGSAPRST